MFDLIKLIKKIPRVQVHCYISEKTLEMLWCQTTTITYLSLAMGLSMEPHRPATASGGMRKLMLSLRTPISKAAERSFARFPLHECPSVANAAKYRKGCDKCFSERSKSNRVP